MIIKPETINFLENLHQHNNKNWFEANRIEYQKARKNAIDFFESLDRLLNEIDDFHDLKVYRINNDIRFDKNKPLYKSHFGAILKRKQPHKRGSFYIHIGYEERFIGAGFWGPNKEDLQLIRKAFEYEDTIAHILAEPALQANFGTLYGNGVKTAPKGFDKTHPRMELIRKQQFLLKKSYPLDLVLSDQFVKTVIADYQILLPFFEYMTEILTLDGNGEPKF